MQTLRTSCVTPDIPNKLSDDQELESKYYVDPDACDLSELTVVTNVVSGRKDIVDLFWENKLGVDVDVSISPLNVSLWCLHDIQNNYRIVVFEESESLNSGAPPLRSHLSLFDGPYRPSDRFLRLHFKECLAVSVCLGDVMEDYRDQEIDNFMEELGVYDGEIDPSDPRWSTPLGTHVHAYLVRQKLADGSVVLSNGLGNTPLMH